MPRSEGNTKRLTKPAKRRYNQATMRKRQTETGRDKGSSGKG